MFDKPFGDGLDVEEEKEEKNGKEEEDNDEEEMYESSSEEGHDEEDEGGKHDCSNRGGTPRWAILFMVFTFSSSWV